MKQKLKENSIKKSRKLSNIVFIILLIVLIFYIALLLSMLVWTFLTSLKGRMDFNLNPIGIPVKWLFKNYYEVITRFYVKTDTGSFVYFPMLLVNTLLYAVGGSFFYTASVCVTSYAVSKYSYKFSKFLYSIVIITMILPIVGALPSEVRIARALNLYDSMIGMWLMKSSFLGMYFLVFHATFKTLPKDFSEAAYVDGATNLRVLWAIILPLVKNTFFTIMLIRFIELWNDYQTPLIYMPSMPTLALGTYMFERSTETIISTVPMKMAGSVVVLAPVIVLFLIFHKRLIGNISMGGIKE